MRKTGVPLQSWALAPAKGFGTMRRLIATLAVGFTLTAPLHAQDQTLGDIRQELTNLYAAVTALKGELSTTSNSNAVIAGDTLQRVDLIERELQRLTSRTEELEFRIRRVVKDGTNRVGDLEFRLCELEPGCDIANLGETPLLGGPVDDTPAMPTVPSGNESVEFAVGERADFERALGAVNAQDFTTAVTLFEDFVRTYSGGPLTGEAHYYRGKALHGMGRVSDAARAYLESFASAPDGRLAADALLDLGISLGALGQLNEACVTLGEVQARFPASPRVADAQAGRAQLGCS